MHAGLLCNSFAERATADDLLLGRGVYRQFRAGDAAQLLDHALYDHTITLADLLGWLRNQICHGCHPLGLQLLIQGAPNTPHFIDWGDSHQPSSASLVANIDNTSCGRPLFGGVVRQFGQGLGWANTNADGKTRVPLDGVPDLAPKINKVSRP